jgi:hypothetical protein
MGMAEKGGENIQQMNIQHPLMKGRGGSPIASESAKRVFGLSPNARNVFDFFSNP